MTSPYSLIPNADCEEVLDVIVQDKCIGSIWLCEGRWDACDERGEPLPGDASLFGAVGIVVESWERDEPDVDDSLPEWADDYANFADWVKEQ